MLLVLLCSVTLVPHAVFGRKDALVMFKRYLPPPLDTDGVVRTGTVRRLLTVFKVLQDESAFMVLGDDGVATNAFFLTRHAANTTHRLDACVVYERDDAFEAFEDWHDIHFPGVTLELS